MLNTFTEINPILKFTITRVEFEMISKSTLADKIAELPNKILTSNI